MTPFIFLENHNCYYDLETENVVHNCEFNPCFLESKKDEFSKEEFKKQKQLWNDFKNSKYVLKLNSFIENHIKTSIEPIFISIFIFWYALNVPNDDWVIGADELYNIYLFKKNNIPSFIIFYQF